MHIPDMRKKEALNWLNDNYFVSVYDQQDNYMTSFENIETTATYFDIPVKKVLYVCRTDSNIRYKGHTLKLYLSKKIKEETITKRK